jgi:hypothetical protein
MASDTSSGLHLIADADLDSLGLRLALALNATRPDPFRTIVIAVPTREMQTWVARRIAEVVGVCMNVEFKRLDEALLPADARVWSASTVAIGVLEALRDWEHGQKPEWDAVKTLLQPPPSTADGQTHLVLPETTSSSQQRRRARFALEMARRFLAYDVSHPDLLSQWEQRHHGELPTALSWQSALWRDVVGHWQASTERPQRLLSAIEDAAIVEGLVVFGFAHFSPRERAALQNAARHRRVDVFLHTLDDRLAGAGDDTLGALWGAPMRETQTALHAMATPAPASSLPEFEKTAGQTRTLDGLRDVVFGMPPSIPIGDSCIEVAAPGHRRSAEALASAIWDDLQANPARQLTDVLVASGDYDNELVWLEDRLRALHRVPINSAFGGRPSRLLDLFVALLELGESECSRRQVVEVLEHPCFRGVLPPRLSAKLAASVAVFFGVDGADPALAYLNGAPLAHWQQGLARLALGAVLGDGEGDGEQLRDVVPPGQRESATTMVAWTSSLLADVRALVQQSLSLTKWAAVLEAFLRGYVQAVDDVDASHWMALVSCIRDLATLDFGGHLVDLISVVELLRASLDVAGGARGHFQAGGVSVTHLQLHRVVPSPVVVLSGLTEGRFPARDGRDPLDVRRALKLAFTTTRDLQAAAFLQALCVAGERVVFVRNRLDTEKDAERAPSPLLADLRQQCTRAGVALPLHAAPLKAYEGNDDGHDLHARLSRDAAQMRAAIDTMVFPPTGGGRPVLANFQRSLTKVALERAGLLAPALPAAASSTAGAVTTQQTKLEVLRELLQYDNVETHAKTHLRMKGWNLEPDEASLVETEPDGVDEDGRWRMVKAVLMDALAGSTHSWPSKSVIDTAVVELLAREQSEGRAPPGGLLAPDVAEDVLDRLDEIGRRITGAGAFALGFSGKVVYGAARSRAAGQRLVPPLRVLVDGRPHDLVGEGPLTFGDRKQALFAHVLFGPWKAPANFRVQLALDAVGLLLAGLLDEGAKVTGVLLTAKELMPECVLQLPSRATAAAWLAGMLRPLAAVMPEAIITPRLLPLADGAGLLAAAKGTPEIRHERYVAAVQAATPDSVERRDQVERKDRALRDVTGFQPPSEQTFYDTAAQRFSLLAEMGVFGTKAADAAAGAPSAEFEGDPS